MNIPIDRLRSIVARKTIEELEAIIAAPEDHYSPDARAAAAAELNQRQLSVDTHRVVKPDAARPRGSHPSSRTVNGYSARSVVWRSLRLVVGAIVGYCIGAVLASFVGGGLAGFVVGILGGVLGGRFGWNLKGYGMADYDVKLSQLHWRVWQDELGLSGTISAYGHVEFGRQGPGTLTILLSTPGRATVNYRICDDYFDIGLTTERALALCNRVNIFSSGAMLVDEAGAIEANLHLFYLPLDDTGALPDEGFLSAWIGPAMSEIENVTKAFAAELKR